MKIGNGQPQVIKDLESEDGKFVKNELINLLQKKLDFLEFEKLYTRISKSYDQFFSDYYKYNFLYIKKVSLEKSSKFKNK